MNLILVIGISELLYNSCILSFHKRVHHNLSPCRMCMQVGVNKRLMVFNEKGDSEAAKFEMILVNPIVTGQSEETDLEEEGCLSFPLIQGKVYRHKWISIEYQSISGEKKSLKLEGWPARLFQHEFDHLDKVRFVFEGKVMFRGE